jgi:hypothetical protein
VNQSLRWLHPLPTRAQAGPDRAPGNDIIQVADTSTHPNLAVPAMVFLARFAGFNSLN